MNFKYFSKNGEILPLEQAVVPISNLEYSYGFGVYETLRVKGKVVYFLSEHTERLFRSAKIIQLDHDFTQQQIEQTVKDLVNKLEDQVYNIKILLIGDDKKEEATVYIIPISPYFPDKKLYKQGIDTITFRYERLYPSAKTLNMLPSYLAYRSAKNADCYDALFINKHDCITEGTRTNFFTIKDRTLTTPQLLDVLEGVTRKMVIKVAKEKGFKIIEQNIKLADLSQYDGAFLTSTSSKIIPIKKIDNFEFMTIPDDLLSLMKYFNEFLDNYRLLY